MVVTGTVTDWRGWAGMAFPEIGQYVVRGRLTSWNRLGAGSGHLRGDELLDAPPLSSRVDGGLLANHLADAERLFEQAEPLHRVSDALQTDTVHSERKGGHRHNRGRLR
jgi:hypothetical protein